MSFRTRRVIIMTPLYMLFEFFLLKYLFSLFYPLDDLVLILITIIIGVLHIAPMLGEEKKSRFITRLLTEISAIWMWTSLMFLIDIIVIYALGHLTNFNLSFLLLLVPLIAIYAYYKAHKLVINEKTIKLDNLRNDVRGTTLIQ